MIKVPEFNESADQMRDFIGAPDFPCVGAKSAMAHNQVEFFHAGSITSPAQDAKLAAALTRFAVTQKPDALYVSFIALFSDTQMLSETEFEKYLWQRIQGLHDADKYAWDPTVSDDPAAADFSMSVGGHAFYIVGLHPGSIRPARRAPMPVLVFNLHNQFEALRHNGQYERMRDIVRQRDLALCGSINPMLAGFGESSEARQYSGRMVDDGWVCPFHKRAA